MNRWQQVKIGDFFEVTNGKTNSDDAVVDGSYPLFDRSTEIKRSNKYLFDNEAIIVPGEGKEFNPKYYEGKYDLHQRAYTIFSKNIEKMSMEYLYYWIDFNKSYLSKMAVGSTVKSLRLYMLQNFPLNKPEYSVQQKIAGILSSVDKAIQETGQIIQKTEKLKKGLMQDLFTKGIGHKKFKKTKIGEIPEEWEIKNMNDVCLLITDGKHGDCVNENNSGYYFISSKDIKDGYIHYENSRQITKTDFDEANKRTQLEIGDLVMTNSGTIGRMAIAEDKEKTKKTTFQKSVAIIRVNKTFVFTQYLMYYFISILDKLTISSNGSAQKNLLLKDLRSLEISLPKLPEQQKIAEILSVVDEKIEINKKIKEKLLRLKKGLMQDIFSQKVEVN